MTCIKKAAPLQNLFLSFKSPEKYTDMEICNGNPLMKLVEKTGHQLTVKINTS